MAGGHGKRLAGPARITALATVAAALLSACFSGQLQQPQAAAISCAVNPSLVNITTTLAYEQGNGNAASGVVIGAQGEVITNNHVVAGAATIDVTVAGNSTRYRASVLGTDITDDVAVLRLDGAPRLHAAALGDSAEVSIGQRVYALGNAHGACRTPQLTAGTVTGLDASTVSGHALRGDPLPLHGLIEADAELAPGVSGGALVNDSAEIVGILAAGYAESDDRYRGFAIPINRAASIARQIIAGRSSEHVHVGPTASLGVEITSTAALPPGMQTAGAVVAYVLAGSPADRLGVTPGCQLLAVGSERVRSVRDLADVLHASKPGQTVRVTWVDAGGATRSGYARLVAGPPQ